MLAICYSFAFHNRPSPLGTYALVVIIAGT